MALLELILLFVLQFVKGIGGETISLYQRPGHDVLLPCDRVSSSTCSNINWLYNRDASKTIDKVEAGKVVRNSARLSLLANCSLLINNITAEDAGFYSCRKGEDIQRDTRVLLYVLTISPSPPDADPNRDEVTIECALWKHKDDTTCKNNSLRWVNETGAVLRGEGVSYKETQRRCASLLTVKRQSGSSRRYTCQFVQQNHVQIEAVYTDELSAHPLGRSAIITIAAVAAGVSLLVVAAAAAAVVLVRHRKRTKATEGDEKPIHLDEPESSLTYVTINHAHQTASPGNKVKEETVTYSAIKTPM